MVSVAATKKAQKAAVQHIVAAIAAGETTLSFDDETFHNLKTIPPELHDVTGLTELDFDNTRIEDLSNLIGLTQLEVLRIKNTRVTDLRPLQGMTGLQTLCFDQTSITDLSPLQGLTGLQELSLIQTSVTDLSPLQGITGLQTLFLDRTNVSDLSNLQGITLKWLSLRQTNVTDLSPLQGMTRLRALSLDQSKVTDLTPLYSTTGLQTLSLNQTNVTDLSPLQGAEELLWLSLDQSGVNDLSAIQDITSLQRLWLSETGISDLAALQGMTRLQELYLNGTRVSDLSPLQGMTELHGLSFSLTSVSDLRLLVKLPELALGPLGEISFAETAATKLDPQLHRLSRIEAPLQRTRDTIAYLKTLPPYPEPLPWLAVPDAPLTIDAILATQTPLGWRFSPTHGAMVVYVQEQPLTAFQSQLATMTDERTRELLAKLSGANHGLRSDVALEVRRFADILSDDVRPLSLRSLELWGSLVALGSHLDANDTGRMQGRDALDMLAVDQRAALMTLLQIAGNLVRSFPDIKAMDDGAGGFLRREVTLDMVAAMIEAALRVAFVERGSAALMQHVAGIGKDAGSQAEKATSVSVRGVANLITTATLLVGRTVKNVTVGAIAVAGGLVIENVAEHYELDQAAIAYIEEIRAQIAPFIDNLPPDEGALLRTHITDMEDRLAKAQVGQQHLGKAN